MTLLVTAFAAVICTALWYKNAPESKMQLGVLCWLFWGAAIMWFVDLVFEYAEEGAKVFEPEFADVLNDSLLGLAVITIALVIWTAVFLICDPNGVVRSALLKKKS